MKKFYSSINQAITLAEVDYGDKKDWVIQDIEEFWQKYLKPYLKYTSTEDIFLSGSSNKNKVIYFPDGSAVIVNGYLAANANGDITWQTTGGHFFFCPVAKDCRAEYFSTLNYNEGSKVFRFGFWPKETSRGTNFRYHYNKGVEPYRVWWDGNVETLYTLCNNIGAYCTAVIQENGWSIPDNYPKKF